MVAVDPCSTAFVTVPAQTDPPDHTYSGPTSYTASYTISEASCAIEYTCEPPTSGTDLCGIGSLDTATGVFQLTTTDMVSYPPGIYPVEIRGSVSGHPSQSNSHTFSLTLVDPCSLATISVPA